MAWRAPFPRERPTWLRAVVLGVSMSLAATALRWSMTAVLGLGLPFISYFPFLLGASIWGGARGGVIALVVSALTAGRFFFAPNDPLRPWALGTFAISGALIIMAGALLAEAVRLSREREERLAATDAQLRMMVSELAHRGRNAITVLMAIVSQSIRGASSLQDAERVVNARLDALVRAQEEVLNAAGKPVPVTALLSRTLAPFDLGNFDITCERSPVVDAEAAATIGLIVHELATNAVKYGALSGGGRVVVHCSESGPNARIEWREVGGPSVTTPTEFGFGERLLTMALTPLGGRTSRRFEPGGVVCELEVPAPGAGPIPSTWQAPARAPAGGQRPADAPGV